MRYIRVPESIIVSHPTFNGGKPLAWSFHAFAQLAWLDDQVWMTPKLNLLALARIAPEFTKPIGSIMELQDADYAILQRVVQTPTLNPMTGALAHGILPQLLIQTFAYEQAVLDATTEKPEAARDERTVTAN